VDDGVRSGLITMAQLREAVPLFARYHDATLAEHPQLGMPLAERRLLYESIRRMLSDQVYDVIAATQQRIAQARPCSVDEVRAQAGPLVSFSDTMRQQSLQLKQFLFRNLYRHEQVMKTMDGAQQVVAELFAAYMVGPDRMKPRFVQRAMLAEDVSARARVVADFIAGMTDRYAAREHELLTGLRLLG
jgi:dGTPase